MRRVREAIRAVLEEDSPMTVRQVFYRLVSGSIIAKTETEYKGTVSRLLSDMRRTGEIPYGWVADNTRWMRKGKSYSSLGQALARTAATYRRALWDTQPVYVEIWLEKDALSGVLYDVTSEWDVPLMVTRGYPSLSFLHEAARDIQEQAKPAHLFYFGDYDPSGLDIPRATEAGLRGMAPQAEIHFTRVAVTEEQISEFGLPTRPTKTTDTRSKGFAGESVEVDAIPPATLREMAERCITEYVDRRALDVLRVAERCERAILYQLCSSGGANKPRPADHEEGGDV
jgi:hypothetical protein